MSDPVGGVVGHRNFDAVLAEDALEVARPLTEFHVDDHVRPEIELRRDRREVVSCGRQCGVLDGELLAVVRLRRPADDQQVDWLDHLAAAERRRGVAGDQLCLVGVVVEHLPDAVEVELRQRARDGLCDPVTERVRVADPLPFDDLDVLVLDCTAIQLRDAYVPHYPHGGEPAVL